MPDDEKKIPSISAKVYTVGSVKKSDTPTQLEIDENNTAGDWPEPPLNMHGLREIVSNSTILPQCIRAYAKNIAGYGINIKYMDDDLDETTESKAEWNKLQDILNLLSTNMDTKETFENVIEARETYGIAYCEVIRNLKGEVVQLDFIEDTPSIRKSHKLDPYIPYTFFYHGEPIARQKRFRKYKQTINGKTVYFKELGDPRIMDKRDGHYAGQAIDGQDEIISRENQANEIIDFPIGTTPYGMVRWVGQLLNLDGARRAEGLNNNYFIAGRHTPMAIIINGGTLNAKSEAALSSYLNSVSGEKGQHKFLLLETDSIDNGFENGKPTVEVKDMASILQKDELFQDYIDNNRRKVQSAFNLPDLYVGYTTDFNRATAQTAQEITEQQVFQPERLSFAWHLNNRLLNGYGFKYVEVEFGAPDITNPDDLYKILSVTNSAGGLTPNKAKQIAYDAIGEVADDYEGEWGDIPLALTVKQSTGQLDAMQGLSGVLQGMPGNRRKPGDPEDDPDLKLPKPDDDLIEKSAGDPDVVVGVMRDVRNILMEIQEGGAHEVDNAAAD